MIFIFDKAGYYKDVLANDHSLIALPPEKIVGAHLADIFPKKEALGFIELFKKSLNTGTLQNFEYELEIDGKPMFFETRISPLDKEHVLSISRDITNRKEYENALTQAEENFRRTLDESPLGMRIVSNDYKTIYANKAILDIYGYDSFEELIKTPIKKRYTPESYKKFIERRAQRLRGEQGPSEYEISIIRKDGEVRNLIVYRKEILWDGIKQSLVIYRDVTDRKQSQKLLEEVAIAKRSLKFKKNFLANMSHEIRTPLTGIMGMAEVLSKTELTTFQKEYLNSLMYSTENLKEVINQILDYSKIEAGEVLLKPRTFSFKSIKENAQKLFESICNKKITFITKIDDDLPEYIKTDEQRVSQIVYNLISNAVKFTDKGSITFRIKLDEIVDTGKDLIVKMEVEDTGIGIRQDTQKQLFKPFSQVEQVDTRNFDGTGLGLSICKDLCEMLEGEIGVKSEPGKGSLFWFTFKAMFGKAPEPKKTKLKIKKPVKQTKIRVLHVEDKLVNQKVVSLLLNPIGCDVITAINGEQALEIYNQYRSFDLILMDIQMPVMDGITATKELRNRHDELPPIIGLSANAFEGDREKYIRLGMDEYITKPVKEEDLVRMLEVFKLK